MLSNRTIVLTLALSALLVLPACGLGVEASGAQQDINAMGPAQDAQAQNNLQLAVVAARTAFSDSVSFQGASAAKLGASFASELPHARHCVSVLIRAGEAKRGDRAPLLHGRRRSDCLPCGRVRCKCAASIAGHNDRGGDGQTRAQESWRSEYELSALGVWVRTEQLPSRTTTAIYSS